MVRTRLQRFRLLFAALLVLGVTVAMLPGPALAAASQSGGVGRTVGSSSDNPRNVERSRPACADAAPGHVQCLAMYRPAQRSVVAAQRSQGSTRRAKPAGYGPQDLWSAYKLPERRGRGQTIAIVAAFDNPRAEEDLNVYRKQFGLPQCTTENGCFRKVNQQGKQQPLPPPHRGWGLEIALDLQMASAVCPRCDLMLVEASNTSYAALGEAVDTAVQLGADVVSNSYGAQESHLMLDFAQHYQHPDTVIVASAGNAGFGPAMYPAVLDSVVAVGGTALSKDDGRRGWTEKAWSGAGSGCSAYIEKPEWQRDDHCDMRTTADVAAVADPKTGVAVYDSFLPEDDAGWQVVGGTSAAAPIIAGAYALAGAEQSTGGKALYRKSNRAHLYDVVGGSSGFCGGDYLCTGVAGYDGPTGLGTPHGIEAFDAPEHSDTRSGATESTGVNR